MTTIRSILSELAAATQQLSRRPLLLALAVVPLALSIAALGALFAVVNGTLLRPAAGIDDAQGRLLEIGRGARLDTLSYPVFQDIARDARSMEAIHAWSILPTNARFGDSAGTTRGLGMLVSGRYFEALGVNAAHGRLLTDADEAAGSAEPRVVLSHAAFMRQLDGDAARLDQPLLLNGHAYTIVGVAEPGFRGHIALLAPDYYLPITLQPVAKPSEGSELLGTRGARWLHMGARMREGHDIDSVNAELETIATRLATLAAPGESALALRAAALRAIPSDLTAPLATFSGLLGVLVVVVLLVACSNVAGWLLARGEARLSELGVRMALGASRARILGLLLAEAVVVAVLAGALALIGIHILLGLLPAIEIPAPFPVDIAVPFDTPVLLFALLATAITVLAAGLAPALRVSRAVREVGSGARATRRARARELLVTAQVALTALLLVGAGLLATALDKSQAIEIGFDPRGLANADLDLEPSGYAPERQQAVLAEILATTRALPGVQAAALARVVPLTLNQMSHGVVVDGAGAESTLEPSVNIVSPGYFDTLGIALSGRDFAASDNAASEGVVVVNRRLAERLFGTTDAIGRSFRYGTAEQASTLRVIGVAADGRYASYQEEPEPFLYLALAQNPTARLNLILRSPLPPAELASAIAKAVASVDPELPLPQVHAMSDTVALSLLPQRIAALVASLLGALGLLLAVLGLYALMAQFVAARTREIGVRLSLGATPNRVGREVALRGVRLVAIGLAFGLLAAVSLARLAESVLFGVDAGSALAFIAAAAVTALAGSLACIGPALRAARTQPIVALRHD
jgi:putative ABC transport system permease protein